MGAEVPPVSFECFHKLSQVTGNSMNSASVAVNKLMLIGFWLCSTSPIGQELGEVKDIDYAVIVEVFCGGVFIPVT